MAEALRPTLIIGSPLKILSVQKEDGVRDSNFVLSTGLFFFVLYLITMKMREFL
jgi:hypothetical protein